MKQVRENIMKAFILALIALPLPLPLSPFSALASETLIVRVNGMVCDFCAQGIEKKLKTDPSIDRVEVSLGEKRVTVVSKENTTLSEERIREALKKAGYSVVGVSKP